MSENSGPVAVVGAGDLGRRIATALRHHRVVPDVLLVGRRPDGGGGGGVRYARADLAQPDALAELLARERPVLVVHCASVLSPWHLAGRQDRVAVAVRRAGFGLQLPAQLPLLMNVVRAVRSAGLDVPVVNCSFPDATHPVLAGVGMAPLIGVGNAGMVEAKVRQSPDAVVRVLAHHAQVDAVMRNAPSGPGPRVYLGEEGRRADALAFGGPSGPVGVDRNAVTAAVAVPVVRALLPGAAPLRTSAPGPDGLPGGWPVTVGNGRVALDLPPGLTLADGLAFQHEAARGDGIESIADGTVRFTAEARAAVADIDPALAAPLHPDDVPERCARLVEVVRG